MTTLNLERPDRVLAIGAHPDDIEFGCGGTLAKWTRHGTKVTLLICTDGSKGSWDLDTDPAALIATRRIEQRRACERLGASETIFLDWPDGELESGLGPRREIAQAIRETKPEVVFGHDPWKRYRLHPDHRHAGTLTIEGIVAARDPHFFPDLGLLPHRPTTLLLFEPDEIDHIEDITGSFDDKIAALLAHKSQLRSTMGIELKAGEHLELSPATRLFIERTRSLCIEHGERGGIELGEAFKRIDEL